MRIGDVQIDPGIMNAACSVAKSIDDVKALAKTPIGAITVGSITVEPRQGNPEPRWYTGDGYALNSFGMPNAGIEFYQEQLPSMIKLAHAAGKKLSLSIAGFNTAEYVMLAKLADDTKVDLLELNLGCPNISIEGKQKPIASFDPRAINEIVEAVSQTASSPLLLKLSPYSNPAELQMIAGVIAKTNKVSAVVTSNTFPNSLMLKHGEPIVAAGFAGFSGHNFLPIGLGQVRQFRKALPETIAVIGVGGIETKADVELYKQAGANGVQAATVIVRDGHKAIERLIA
jgi:dihydroorotate dehydrogenase (fumarate)